jgi:hypothetical protein
VGASPSAVFAEPLKSAAGSLFPQAVQIFLAVIIRESWQGKVQKQSLKQGFEPR